MTIDEALESVAKRSFYEDCKLTPAIRDREIITEDDYHVAPADGVFWTYDDGIVDSDGKRFDVDCVEVSRCMEPCEFFATAEHIRYHMAESVEALEAGKPVSFSYQVVNSLECGEPVGWCLIAKIWN